MKVVHNDNCVYYDVDDTLVLWNFTDKDYDRTILIGDPDFEQRVLPHLKHIQSIKNAKARGHFVVVWSAGGSGWAEAVVHTLGLTPYVDLVITKPKWYYDDIPLDKWHSERFYFEDK